MGVLSTLYIVFCLNDSVDSVYLTYFYETILWHKDVLEQASEGARNHGLLNISADQFLQTHVMHPSLPEQQKIGAFFQNFDNLINLQQQELDKLTNIKSACLSKMFA